MDFDVTVTISGPEHSGKTALMVAFERFLQECGAEVVVQKADSQLDEKREHFDVVKQRLRRMRVFINETQLVK